MSGCCKDCQDRKVGCHAECAKYIKAKAEHDEEQKAIRRAQEGDIYLSAMSKKWHRIRKSYGERMAQR